jgi:ChrR Cupin-like domain
VRYAPSSQFSPHTHSGGEEFIVLEGVFSDEHGDYPAGRYIRNPPTTRHTPGSAPGCVIFAKLWQFDPADRTSVMIDTSKIGHVRDLQRPGIEVTPLFEDARETVELQVWQPQARWEQALPGGAELFVLDGGLVESGDELVAMSWLRVPGGAQLDAKAGLQGAHVWVKARHVQCACEDVLSR